MHSLKKTWYHTCAISPQSDEEEDRLRFLDATPAHDFEVDDGSDEVAEYAHVSDYTWNA